MRSLPGDPRAAVVTIIPIDSSLLLTPIRVTTTAKLSSGAAATPKPYAKDAPLAPWQTPVTLPDNQLISRLMSNKPIIDTRDPMVLRAGGNESYTAMFAAYQALGRMVEAADYAATGKADGIRKMLDSRFRDNVQRLVDFISQANIAGVTVIGGVKQGSITSTALKPIAPTVYTGAKVTDDRAAAIAGLTGTEKFTIRVEKDAVPTDVLIDLAGMTDTLNIDNVASYINAQLTAANVSTRVEVKRNSEFDYALAVVLGSNETATFTPDAANTQPALYVVGSSGVGDFGDGQLRKLDDLSAAAPTDGFLSRIATNENDTAKAVATDSKGNVYVLGTTAGDLGGEVNRTGKQSSDVALSKYDASGKLVFTRMLGATGDTDGLAIAIDASDNVVIAGRTETKLNSSALGGMSDSFVTKFNSAGQELWTRQAGSVLGDAAMAITTDASGNVFLAGRVSGTIPGATASQGGEDAYLSKLDANGMLQWSKQFGSAGNDQITGIKVDSSGNVVVAGTMDGNGFVRKYADAATDDPPVWSVDLGALGTGATTGLAIDDSGRIFVSGSTSAGTLNGGVAQAYSGGIDGFVTSISDAGTSAGINYVSYLGSAGDDRASGLAAAGGAVYLTGDTTRSIGGQALNGARDSFTAKLDATSGALTWAKQYGGTFSMTGGGIALDTTGTSVVTRLGLSAEPFPRANDDLVVSATSARVDEYFTIAVNGGVSRKITLEAGDSFTSLAIKINRVLGSAGRASVETGGALKIKAADGSDIRIEAGAKDRDLLASLGLQAARLFGVPPKPPASKVSAAVEAFIGSAGAKKNNKDAALHVYDLGLGSNLKLDSKKNAEEAASVIKAAMRKLRDAYRFSVTGVDPNETKPKPGPASTYMQAKISAYSNALQRLEGGFDSSSNTALSLFGI
jgi:hypothetical protein